MDGFHLGPGPFFALDRWRAGQGWRPLDELVSSPAVLRERVDLGRAIIAERAGLPAESVEPRVAASIVSLGVFARLLSPALGATVLSGVVPSLTVGALWWRPVAGGPWPMAINPVPESPIGDLSSSARLNNAAGVLMDIVVSGVVAPVLEAFERDFRISRKVLWGNVASGLGGAVGMLGAARPDRCDVTARLVVRMLELPPLLGTGELVHPVRSRAERFFVRRSCCLFYRVPGAGTCGDCVLTPAEVRRQQWESVLRR